MHRSGNKSRILPYTVIRIMTYIVNDGCIKCKHMDCVEVCPVDCFYEGANILVINPQECIDCGVCQPECPVDAILPENKVPEGERQFWIDFNQKWSDIWPNITQKRPEDVPKDHAKWQYRPDKLNLLDENPGKGDPPEEDE